MDPIQIGNKKVGDVNPVLIIAEAGVNHNGDIRLAHQLIDIASQAGADAVKFQSFFTEDLITQGAPKVGYQLKSSGDRETQYDMLKVLELSEPALAELKVHCDEKGLIFLCTPYEAQSVDLLERLNIPAFKISSTDITNIPLLRYVAKKGRPVILSTGMSTLGEVEQAVDSLRSGGLDGKIVLLHCTSEYPSPLQEINLRAMAALRQAFHCPVGYSDHAKGIEISSWAVALGACIIEKHFTLDHDLPGPDHKASLEPAEMNRLVSLIRDLEIAMGDGIKRPMPSEIRNKSLMQKSLVARTDIRAGEFFSSNNLTCKRPGTGLSPSWYDIILGKRAAADIPKDGLIDMSSVHWTKS